MESTPKPLVTILIPHYKTLELTKLCLRSLKKYTDLANVNIIVLDNGSKDASTEYLRTLDWITLVEREPTQGDRGPAIHCKSLDAGVAMVNTPYFLSFHTDTIVVSSQWLDFLLDAIRKKPGIAGVGSWKLEHKTFIKRLAKQVECFWQVKIWHPLLGRSGSNKVMGVGDNFYYLRSHCALYDTELFKKHTNGFMDGEETAGKAPHQKLVEAGYEMVFLPSEELSQYVRHINHATMVLNPEIAGKGSGSPKQYKRVMKEMSALDYKQILSDSSLD
jgi:GT2 family glycosyltransferase